MSAPLVSVIVPAFNHEPYLEARLISIFTQTFQDFEVILLDDCSSDRSVSVISAYWGHPKVTALGINTRNSGSPFKQWQRGVAHARGKYIWIAESDDMADPDFLSTLILELERKPGIGIAYCQSHRMNERGVVQGTWKSHTDDLDPELFTKDFEMGGILYIQKFLIHRNTIPNASGVVFRKTFYEAVGGVEEDVPLCSDWLTWLKILTCSDVFFCARPLNYFRNHRNSVMFKALRAPKAKRKVDLAVRKLRYRFQVFLGSMRLDTHPVGLANAQFLEEFTRLTDACGRDASSPDTPAPTQKLVVVLGMHRSGTSAITRILATMGVALGDNLMPPTKDNEKGYFEDLDIYSLNSEMLKSLGMDWHTVQMPDSGMQERLLDSPFFQRASNLLAAKVARCSVLGIKDPRFSLLLPFWSKVFVHTGLNPYYIIGLRAPEAVVRSVFKRDHYVPNETGWVWINYNLCAMRFTKDSPRLWVDYQQLLENPVKQAGRISQFLNLSVHHEDLHEYEKKFMDPALNHAGNKSTKILLNVPSLPLAEEIYTFLYDIASDRNQEGIFGPAFQKWTGLMQYVYDLHFEVRDREQSLEALRKRSILHLLRAKINALLYLLHTIQKKSR